MNLYTNDLMHRYFYQIKQRVSFYFPDENPYYECDDIENDPLIYRPDFVDLRVEQASKLWLSCDFSNECIVVYEDKYNKSHKKEQSLVQRCIEASNCSVFPFIWQDDSETFSGTRFIFQASKIDHTALFRNIILSDIGDDTELDCAVSIIDDKTKNIFFLYDDRGVDVFTNNENFIRKLKSMAFIQALPNYS